MDDLIIRAVIAGVGVALTTGVLGCFVVWRRMAYFGDSLAHSALLGIALGLFYGFNLNIGTTIVCSLFALLLVWLRQQRVLATDTLLGILAHAALSIGMVTISLLRHQTVNLQSYLFGDILTVTTTEIYWIYGGGILVLGLLCRYWSALTLMTIDEDLAKAEGVKNLSMHLLLTLLMAVVVAISIRIVGILLITALLIIPAASARLFTRSPESMAMTASCLGAMAVIGGLFLSLSLDTPSGPSIVVIATVFFVVCLVASTLKSSD